MDGRRLAAGLAAGLVACLTAACAPSAPTPPATTATGPHTVTQTSGTISSVADGDTFTMIASNGTKTKVRVLGIDAPEMAEYGNPAQCGAAAAKAAMQAMLPQGTAVTIVTDPVSDQMDVYGRVLAYATTAKVPDVGLHQLQAGLAEAWVPSGQPHNTRWAQYSAAAKAAKAARTGSWATCPSLGR
ncbi:MAG: thermonuclease family protein [Propionibacteriaceae bacterium]|nr:thermonuclease family protein [Propionibacteriaceae bacterium]